MATIDELRDDFELLDRDDRIRMIIELGEALEPMPDALKTDDTLVRGCASKVWLYPTCNAEGRLHFLADGTSAITKGVVALVLETVQDRTARDVLDAPIEGVLADFNLSQHLTSQRTQGIPNMIALIRETAARYA